MLPKRVLLRVAIVIVYALLFCRQTPCTDFAFCVCAFLFGKLIVIKTAKIFRRYCHALFRSQATNLPISTGSMCMRFRPIGALLLSKLLDFQMLTKAVKLLALQILTLS